MFGTNPNVGVLMPGATKAVAGKQSTTMVAAASKAGMMGIGGAGMGLTGGAPPTAATGAQKDQGRSQKSRLVNS